MSLAFVEGKCVKLHAHYALEGTSNYQGMNLKVGYDIY
jgi:hypothetical protein